MDSGFVLKASIWLKALRHFCPQMAAAAELAWKSATIDVPFVRPGTAEFSAVPSDSIDCAVMERCPKSPFSIQMVELDAGWNDLGSWEAVWSIGDKDNDGNVTNGDALTVETTGTHIHASSRLVAAVGVNELIIVETSDAVLIADRSRSQNVKHLVTLLEQQKREVISVHRKVHRPWGWYDSIDESDRFKVKRIHVNPHASLSLQKHYHRAEHWIVVRGVAEVTCGDKVTQLTENQSTFIPLGEMHRLANPGTDILEIIEVQSGSYLGEDDIVRFDDKYGRKVAEK